MTISNEEDLAKLRVIGRIVANVLRDMQANPDGSRIKIDDILKIIGRHFNVGRTDLLSPRRARSVVVPRQIGIVWSRSTIRIRLVTVFLEESREAMKAINA